MKHDNKNIIYERTTNPKNASELHTILQTLLLTPGDYNNNKKKSKLEQLSKEGYIIGKHSVANLEKMIKNPKNNIFIIRDMEIEPKIGNIIGYTLILGTDEIIKEVQQYAEETEFILTKAKNHIENKHFVYLIQVAIKKEYSNLDIGSKLLDFVFKSIDLPIVSFVMKSPLRNEISIYYHLKNGFQYFGEYYGAYDEFKNYRSAAFIYFPNTNKPSKEEIKEIYKKI